MNSYDTSQSQFRESLGRIIRFRDAREAFLGKEIFRDPGWDILLDLTTAKLDQKDVAVGDACIASRSARATAHRYLQLLLQAGFIEIGSDRSDRRRCIVQLTEGGFEKIRGLLIFEENWPIKLGRQSE